MSNAIGDDAPPPSIAPARWPGAVPELPRIPAPSPYGSPTHFPVEFEPEPPGERRRVAVGAVLTAVLVAVAGLGIGLLWLQVAPRIGIIKVTDGFVYADQEPEEAIAADGVFGFLGLGVGVAFALLAWALLRRYRGVAVLLGLVIGSLLGAWLAWWLGVRLGLAQFEAVRDALPVGTRIEAPLALRLTDLDRHAYWPPKMTGVVAVQAMAAAATYTTLAGFSIHPGLRARRSQQDIGAWPGAPAELSSDPAVPADRTS